MKSRISDLKEWLKEICWGEDSVDTYVEKGRSEGEGTNEGFEERFSVYVYTDTHKYCIAAVERSKDDGYLGCIASTRKPRAGEDWTRGNDLPDGKLCRETWENIKNGIIRYELVPLAPKVKYRTDEIVSGQSGLVSGGNVSSPESSIKPTLGTEVEK